MNVATGDRPIDMGHQIGHAVALTGYDLDDAFNRMGRIARVYPFRGVAEMESFSDLESAFVSDYSADDFLRHAWIDRGLHDHHRPARDVLSNSARCCLQGSEIGFPVAGNRRGHGDDDKAASLENRRVGREVRSYLGEVAVTGGTRVVDTARSSWILRASVSSPYTEK